MHLAGIYSGTVFHLDLRLQLLFYRHIFVKIAVYI